MTVNNHCSRGLEPWWIWYRNCPRVLPTCGQRVFTLTLDSHTPQLPKILESTEDSRIACVALEKDMERQHMLSNSCVNARRPVTLPPITHHSSPEPSGSENPGRCVNPCFCSDIGSRNVLGQHSDCSIAGHPYSASCRGDGYVLKYWLVDPPISI